MCKLSADALLEQPSHKFTRASVKHGPCERTIDPVLQKHNICRQKYFGGTFIGNHIHYALQRQVTHQLTHAHIEVVAERCPEMLFEAFIVAERYSKLMTKYADCRDIFSSSSPIDEQILNDLADNISSLMSTARQEIVQRQKGNIRPKLHLLEGHVVSAMRCYGVGLGMLGEQGGESIHAEFNTLAREFKHTVEDLDRLRMIVNQHGFSS